VAEHTGLDSQAATRDLVPGECREQDRSVSDARDRRPREEHDQRPDGPAHPHRREGGKDRTTPLAYFTDGDEVILIASRGGHRKHPAWYHNALANPEVELWTKGGGGRYRAQEAKGEDRQRLWDLATGFYPGFARYQERAGDRVIPVVVCSPQDD
jgi:deazaflavin-dependent oxidoreductase (nitroreductase family)